MRAVLQRVTRARVLVDGDVAGEIGLGLVVLIAVGLEDTAATSSSMAEKIVNLRIFGDEQGKMNRSLLGAGGAGRVAFTPRRPSKARRCTKNLCALCRHWECASRPEFFRRTCPLRSSTTAGSRSCWFPTSFFNPPPRRACRA